MAHQAEFITDPGGAITAFALGDIQETYFPGEITKGVDDLTYEFVNGKLPLEEAPCRKALRKEIAARSVELRDDFPVTALHLPGFNRRVEFSGFWHRPTRLARWIRTQLAPGKDGTSPFRLSTCGGVHIWADGVPVAGFEPYSRNEPRSIDIDIPLKAEGTEVVLLLEEMAERDTSYFIELIWLGTDKLKAQIPTSADAETLATLTDLARSIHPEKMVFTKGDDLQLRVDRAAPHDVTVRAAVLPTVHMTHMPPLLEIERSLKAGQSAVSLGSIETLPDSYHGLDLELCVGETRVHRHIGFAFLRDPVPTRFAEDLAARKSQALAYSARHGDARIGRVLAHLEQGGVVDAKTLAILDDTLETIDQRKDCSDFVMVPLLWVYGKHADQFTQRDQDRMRKTILGYRYWVDEPGNDAMWFWSENHVLCFLVSALMAGQLFPETRFENSGITGAQQVTLAKQRLGRWFDAVETHGLGEWNSAAYYPIDFIGLMGLYEFAQGAIQGRAKGVLDSVFEMTALHCLNGVSAGSMGRAYDKELRAGPLTELSFFAAVGFGIGWFDQSVAAISMFCASDYAPPETCAEYADPPEGRQLSARYVQGFGAAARLALCKSKSVQLSASIDGEPGKDGHQQHMVDVLGAGHPFARVWINHPGEDDPWGSNRPSFWAGNGIIPRVGMHEGTCLFLSDLGADPRLAFTHAYAPLDMFDACEFGRDWIALRTADGFVTLKATGPIETIKEGPGAGLEHRCHGAQTGWAVQVGELPPGGLAEVARRAEASSLQISDGPLQLSLTSPDEANLVLDYAKGLLVDGSLAPFSTVSTQPQTTWRFLTSQDGGEAS
ncbi:MAG: hypothetical protein ACSHXD_05735 [Marinosulfonomonas sp.]